MNSVGYVKTLAVTVVALVALLANRFVSNDGSYGSATGGAAKDVLGVSETGAAAGETVAVVVNHSYPVVAAEPITKHAYVKPATDGTGRAAVGTLADHCGVALNAADAGQLVEVRLLPHRHA